MKLLMLHPTPLTLLKQLQATPWKLPSRPLQMLLTLLKMQPMLLPKK
jgi:hypothetical protein